MGVRVGVIRVGVTVVMMGWMSRPGLAPPQPERAGRQHQRGNHAEHEGTELEFVIMVIAVSCVKLLSAHNSTQHTSRKHKV
jgi:hypothetical protein